jgi:hypothetical protein
MLIYGLTRVQGGAVQFRAFTYLENEIRETLHLAAYCQKLLQV